MTGVQTCALPIYRSTQTILTAANAVISQNAERRPKNLWTADGQGDHIIRLTAVPGALYAIDNERGIQRLARAKDGTLQFQGSIQVPRGAPWGLTTVGPYLFVTTLLHSLYGLDLSTPSQPRLLSTTPYGGAALVADGPMLYVAVRGRRGEIASSVA